MSAAFFRALGLTAPMAAGSQTVKRSKGDPGLTDADFPTDATARRREDEAREQRRRDEANRPKADAKPSAPDPVDPVVKEAEDAIGDPAKRLKAMADARLPRFEAEFDADTPAIRLIKDFESSLKKAAEYTNYINKTMDFVIKTGAVAKVSEAVAIASSLKNMTGRVLGAIASTANAAQKAREALALLHQADHFADATMQLNMNDRKSVERWVKASKSLYNAAAPFIDWAHTAAVAEAFGGSALAGKLAASIPIAGAEFMAALEALDQGLKNEGAYFARYDRLMKKIFDEPDAAPPPTPAPWKSREELSIEAGQRDENTLRRFVGQRKQWVEEDKRLKQEQAKKDEAAKHKKEIDAAAAALAATKQEFEGKVFVATYQKIRPELRTKILVDVRKRRAGAVTWMECFLAPDDVGLAPRDMDEVAGVSIPPTKAHVSDNEAQFEIHNFEIASPKCPLFDQAHAAAWKAFAAKKGIDP